MRLFLASSFKDTAGIFADFEKDAAGRRVTFIPTASMVEKVRFYVSSGRKRLESLGMIIDELEISSAGEEQIAEKIKKNDYIYVTGGNTFYLLQELKRTGADKLIREQVMKGKLYIGESAGAMVCSPDITYARHMDSSMKAPELTDYAALKLVDFYTIPHYTNPPFERAAQKMKKRYSPELNMIPISNEQAILVDNNNTVICGG